VTGRLAEMTWLEVAQALAGGVTTVILPLGATEQHGPHLPLGTDTVRAAALAEALAEQLTQTLVAPVLPIGCSDEHSGFPGLLSLEGGTLARVIVDCARRMAAWGLQRLILLSAHGGNDRALVLAAEILGRELPALQVRIPGGGSVLPKGMLAVARQDGVSPEAVGLHAGEGETSEMLYLRADLVRMELAVPGYTGDMKAILPTLLEAGLKPVTSNGVLGDPRKAQGIRGRRYLAAEVKEYRDWLASAPREECP
jgi:creatinine amidohydrolase